MLPAITILVAAGGIGLARLWPGLHADWSNIYGAFSHGYLVLILSAWLGVRFWRQAPPSLIAPYWPAFIALLGLVLVLLLMEFLFINSARLALLPLLILAVIGSVFGLASARALLLPVGFLYLALPVWWVINAPMQELTVAVAGTLVRLTGLPAYLEGNFVHVPAGAFEIASGCSGLNYLVAALSLSGFHALAYLRTWKNRMILMAATTVAALISNWIRVYSLIVIGIETDMQHYLIKVDHLYYGWILFMCLMAPVFYLAGRLADRETDGAPPVATATPAIASPRNSVSLLLASVVAGLTLLIPRLLVMPLDAVPSQLSAALPGMVGGMTRAPVDNGWAPVFLNSVADSARYSDGSSAVDVYRAVYAMQTADARLIRPDNNVLGPGWRTSESQVIETRIAGQDVSVTEYRGHLRDRERLMWAWYWVAGRPARTSLEAKFNEIRGLFSGRRDAVGVAVTAECIPDCAVARSVLSGFIDRGGASIRWERNDDAMR